MFIFHKRSTDFTSWKDNLVMTLHKGQLAFDNLQFGMERIDKTELHCVRFCYCR